MLQPNDYLGGAAVLSRATSVLHLLALVKPWMDDPGILEIYINRPGEVWFERGQVIERHVVEALTYKHLESLATAVAKFCKNEISSTRPILSAILPGGERVQIVMPPACEHGTISVTIRKPSFEIRKLEDYEKQGFFENIRPITQGLSSGEKMLMQLKDDGKYLEFLRTAVKQEKIIVIAGETGSGKTTFMKGLMEEIPSTDRIITIEDVAELFLPNHPNHVHLFYPSEAKEEENAIVTPASLLKSCLRMKPKRILLAELRGGETFDFINVGASGHGGGITSVHAGSAELTFERMALMILQNRQGRMLPYEVIRKLLYLVVDVVVHVHNDTDGFHGRHITEMWYDPMKKRERSSQGGVDSAEIAQMLIRMQNKIDSLEERLQQVEA
ncbi:P-type DNA transfer ATPase VirB11 [Pseudomonas sp. LB3P58]